MAILWALAMLASGLFFYQIELKLWIVTGLYWIALYVAGLILLIVHVIYWTRNRYKIILFVRNILFLIAVGVGAHFLSVYSYDIFVHFKMPVYEEIVARESAQYIPGGATYKGVSFFTDFTDGKLRIAFPDGRGILDNWCGLVWDQSGLIGEAANFNDKSWEDPEFQKIKSLFGGDLIMMWHREGQWYFACFT